MTQKIQITTPTLTLQPLGNSTRWHLSTTLVDEPHENLYTLEINHGWNGKSWNEYSFTRHDAGVTKELIAEGEYIDALIDIPNYEDSDKVAQAEESYKARYDVIDFREQQIREELIKRYEAVTVTLEVFNLSINI